MKFRYACLFFLLILVSESLKAQIYGCTDPLANNFNSIATDNDGSCLYTSAAIAPVTSVSLDPVLSETSGLICWNDRLLSHNDNTDTVLYALDTLSGSVLQQYPLTNISNYDWEDISSDSLYIYIGDFGNNVNGNRTDLHILRIEKSSLLSGIPVIDTIYFSYSNQTDFSPTGANNTDFDCEAFIVSHDSIFLFTKQWVSNKTAFYSMPKVPGTYVANFRGELNVQGMITGATYIESKRLIALCAYTSLLQPFLYLLYDFTGNDFFNGNKRSISISLPFHQIEGIATNDGLKYYCSNEAFAQPPVINTPQKLHTFDLSAYLSNYFGELILSTSLANEKSVEIFPVPATGKVQLRMPGQNDEANYNITDHTGKVIASGILNQQSTELEVSSYVSGIYFVRIRTKDGGLINKRIIIQ